MKPMNSSKLVKNKGKIKKEDCSRFKVAHNSSTPSSPLKLLCEPMTCPSKSASVLLASNKSSSTNLLRLNSSPNYNVNLSEIAKSVLQNYSSTKSTSSPSKIVGIKPGMQLDTEKVTFNMVNAKALTPIEELVQESNSPPDEKSMKILANGNKPSNLQPITMREVFKNPNYREE